MDNYPHINRTPAWQRHLEPMSRGHKIAVLIEMSAFLLLCIFIAWMLLTGMAWAQGAPCPAVNLNAIIQIESSGNPFAVSKDGCIGLMQVSESVRQEYNYGKTLVNFMSKYDLFNPAYNVSIGNWYLNTRIPQYLKAYKIPDTIENRLICYHDGIGNLIKYKQGKRSLGPMMLGYLWKYKRLTRAK